MTALRQSAIMELEKIPEDKLSFVIQIMQWVNGLYNDTNSERKEAFARLEQLRKKGTVTDDDAEFIKGVSMKWDFNDNYSLGNILGFRKSVITNSGQINPPAFFEDAKKVILSCTEGNTKGCIAAHSISNMFFILRKDYTAKERREILSSLCTIFDLEGIDKAKLLSGLANEDFSDFEDCLQMECAKSYGADYIVTRNVSDYSVSDIKAILPSEYLGL